MGQLTCRSCKAVLPRRGARCRACGWAANYGNDFNPRERQVLVGFGLMMVGLAMALMVTIAIAYLGSV
jgi:hypothetical protein